MTTASSHVLVIGVANMDVKGQAEEAGAAVWAITIVVAIMDYASAKVQEKVV